MGILHPALGEGTNKMIKAILIASLATVALAEAEADPHVYSGLGGYTGLGHLGYGHLGYGYGLGYGKRSADAEPEAKAEADPYYGYGYGLGYAGHHLGYAGHHLGYAGYRGYHGLGYYGGLRYYGKRSADAEADPYFVYGGLGYAGYGHGVYGYGHGLGLGYGLGYGHRYVYGKRSADAEPEAKADPYLVYGGLGYTDTDWDTSDTPVISDTDTDSDTAPDTTMASRLHQDLSVNQLGQKWIVISLNFPSPVLQFQCYHTKSLVMVSRKQENQSGKNPTNIKITK